MDSKKTLMDLFESISPVLISPKSKSLTISLSKRFLLFRMLKSITEKIEDDPHLNFVSLLKYYKVFTRVLEGSVKELYRDRKKGYFKNFFYYTEVYKRIKEDIEYVYGINPDVNMVITKEGLVVYDNYNPNKFNTLLMTVHSGSFVPSHIQEKMNLSVLDRFKEEDIDSDRLYCRIVLEKGGVWIDNKLSRFYCDVNRNRNHCIYTNEERAQMKGDLWKKDLTNFEKKRIHELHTAFYTLLKGLLDSYRFNIVIDAHTMKKLKNRPDVSFGTHFIPKFYHPIVKNMKFKMKKLGYSEVAFNKPYEGGFIVRWFSVLYSDLFIFSMELSKNLYMNKARTKTFPTKVKKIGDDLIKMLDINEEGDFFMDLSTSIVEERAKYEGEYKN